MELPRLFLVTSFILCAVSDVIQTAVTSEPYCVPEVWQGSRATTTGVIDNQGKATVTRTFGRTVYSAKLHKMMIEDNVFGSGDAQYVKHIYDFPDKLLYTITDTDTEHCTKTTLDRPWAPQCVPAGSTISLTNSTYGTGKNSVTVLELSGTQLIDINFRVTMTPDTHVPVFEQLWGSQHGENFFQTLAFNNLSISNDIPASVFDPPSSCDHVPLTPAVGRRSRSSGFIPVTILP